MKKNVINLVLVFLLLIGISLSFGGHLKSNNADDSKNGMYEKLELFARVLTIIKMNYVKEVSSKDLIYGALRGVLNSLDPYSHFLDPETYEDMMVDTEGMFGGLGIEITIKDGILTVITPMEGTPAFKQGVKAGDKILKIDGESTENITLLQAVKKLRGKIGTKVTITIFRPSTKEIKDITIVRDEIKVHAVKDAMILPDTKIGYVRIVKFQENTGKELEDAIKKLGSDLKGLIIDLRNNPGGLLDEAVNVAQLFIDKRRLIVYTKGRNEGQNKEYYSRRDKKIIDCPLVILVNSGSASASEIVSGAIQDWREGVLVGEKTFGKGSVQSVIPLKDGSALKLTTALYFTPKGRVIHEKGIVPDVEVKLTQKDEEEILKKRKEHIEHPEKKDIYIDSQLRSAIDVIRGISVFLEKNKKTVKKKSGIKKSKKHKPAA